MVVVQVHGYALFKAGKQAAVRYPVEGYPEDVAGRSFHHGGPLSRVRRSCVSQNPKLTVWYAARGPPARAGRFVQRLRQASSSLPNVTMRQGLVTRLLNAQGTDWQEGQVRARGGGGWPVLRGHHGGGPGVGRGVLSAMVTCVRVLRAQVVTGVLYKDAQGQDREAKGHLTIVCDGMYSNFRKQLAQPTVRPLLRAHRSARGAARGRSPALIPAVNPSAVHACVRAGAPPFLLCGAPAAQLHAARAQPRARGAGQALAHPLLPHQLH